MRRLLTVLVLLLFLSGASGCFRPPKAESIVPAANSIKLPNGRKPKSSRDWEEAAEHHRGVALVCDKQAESAQLRERQATCYWIMGICSALGVLSVVAALFFLQAFRKQLLLLSGACFTVALLTYIFAAFFLPYLKIIACVAIAGLIVAGYIYARRKSTALRQFVKGFDLIKPGIGDEYKSILRGVFDERSEIEIDNQRARLEPPKTEQTATPD